MPDVMTPGEVAALLKVSEEDILAAIEAVGGGVVITADHGNADWMGKQKNGQQLPMVAHTKNPVPFVIVDYNQVNSFLQTYLPYQIYLSLLYLNFL